MDVVFAQSSKGMCIAILFICLLLHIGSVDTQTDGFQAVDGFAQGDGFNKPDHPQSSFSAEGFVPAERDQASIDRARSTNGFQTIPVGKPAFNDRLGQRREPSNVNTEVVGDSRRNAIAMTKSVFANIANALDNLPPFPPNNEPNIHEPRSAWMQSDPNQSDIPMGVNGVDDGMTIWEESLQSVQQEMGINGSFPNFISEGIASGLDPMSNANTNLPADNSFGKAEPIPSANKPNVPDDNRINKISQGIPDSLRNNPMDFSLNDVLPISTEVAANAESVTDLRGRSSGLGTNIGVDTPMVNAGAEIQPDLVPQERAFPFDTQGMRRDMVRPIRLETPGLLLLVAAGMSGVVGHMPPNSNPFNPPYFGRQHGFRGYDSPLLVAAAERKDATEQACRRHHLVIIKEVTQLIMNEDLVVVILRQVVHQW
ncbi:hypothetical protein MAR_036686 [Mya arenaria]|uniref:Uncharacterized protein n=1 Tax=Mya arenaria TaxID=6604 RepID=A0ABY7FLK3_MYAAR|nr:hypothetical protein MAR_036686 [Mya arenaria]